MDRMSDSEWKQLITRLVAYWPDTLLTEGTMSEWRSFLDRHWHPHEEFMEALDEIYSEGRDRSPNAGHILAAARLLPQLGVSHGVGGLKSVPFSSDISEG